MEKLKAGNQYIVDIEKIIFGGEGLTHINDIAVFVPMSVPGDRLLIEIISTKKTYARGLIKEILIPSDDRIDNKDMISFEDFSGCDFAMIKYDKQLYYKKEMVLENIKKIANIKDIPFDEIIASDNPDNYRNKVIEPIFKENGIIYTGFYSKKSHKIFRVEKNLLSSYIATKMINIFLEKINKIGFKVYNEANNTGFLKHIMIRNNDKNEVMIAVMIHKKSQLKNLINVLKEMYEENDNIKSVYIIVKNQADNILLSGEYLHLFGERYIFEYMKDMEFKIYPNSFFQINKEQSEKLYNKVIEYIGNTKDKNIVDAFCGTGTISMILAKNANKVIGIDMVSSSIESAKEMAKQNKLSNVIFIESKVEKVINEIIKKENINYIVLDPARKGVDEKALNSIGESRVDKIIYVSCNPSTFARDLSILIKYGYKLEKLSIVDMFCNTNNIESIALLKR